VKRIVYNFWCLKLRERDNMEDIGLDGRIILRYIFTECGCGSIDWIDLAQDRDSWRTLVNTIMNNRVLLKAGNFLTP
jgi:hypothetical protein